MKISHSIILLFISIFLIFISFYTTIKKNTISIVEMLKIKSISNKFYPFLSVRKSDAHGSGHFGASRKDKFGNKYKHRGIDLISNFKEPFYAPFDCVFVRGGFVYANNKNFKLVKLQGIEKHKDYSTKIMYVEPLPFYNPIIKKGDLIGYTQNIQSLYSNITPHVHFELYKNNKLTDPTPYV